MTRYDNEEPSVTVPVELREDFREWEVDEKGFVLTLTERLPDVCLAHGRPAIARRSNNIRFAHTKNGWQQTTATNRYQKAAGSLPRAALVAPSPPDHDEIGLLDGEWPACMRCLARARWARWMSYSLWAVGFVLMYAMFVMWSTGQRIPLPLVVSFFPGWLPFGIAAGMLFYRRSTTFVYCLQIPDMTKVVLRAHPRFIAAYGAGTTTREH